MHPAWRKFTKEARASGLWQSMTRAERRGARTVFKRLEDAAGQLERQELMGNLSDEERHGAEYLLEYLRHTGQARRTID